MPSIDLGTGIQRWTRQFSWPHRACFHSWRCRDTHICRQWLVLRSEWNSVIGWRLLVYWLLGLSFNPCLIPTPPCLCFIPLCSELSPPLCSISGVDGYSTALRFTPSWFKKLEENTNINSWSREFGPSWVRGATPSPINYYSQDRNI